MAKPVGKALRTGPACAPFRTHLAAVRAARPHPTAWKTVQAEFLRAMEAFDNSVMAGKASEGERQNGKGDYFNDLLAVLLENASGVPLNKRQGVPGLIFSNHNLDVTFPETGNIVEVLIEAKMLGTPRHPGNETTQKEVGRAGVADFPKRVKEAGFKTIDLKAAYGHQQAEAGREDLQVISGSLTSWLRQAKPKSYLLAAIRVVSETDRKAVLAVADAIAQVMDGVGLFLYAPKGYKASSLSPANYEPVDVPGSNQLGKVLHNIAADLRHAARNYERPESTPSLPPPPAAGAARVVEQARLELEVEEDGTLPLE